ncbi:MAG: hypothetical protein A3C36_00815 [Omnitrophica WOR_2 bacterium RIFCSPHIGHO2_02_FULL_52_10]|nr:MAG: hypothetical protein A3C36_00815 [Omnitrophica WOR_2 bacterium RIFCSPHIGHO2_02_FULL_52_10]
MGTFRQKLLGPPRYRDVFVLALFTILITWHPYFADGKINIFEVGLYLPGIQSVLSGEIPFRDFFHLRGPFELYMPAFLMKLFGAHIKVLYAYFYFGTVLGLILCILIAKELLKTRYILYLMAPVLIGRTFPRVVFTYWGGMRYALGLLALWFVVKFFQRNKPGWMFGAGVVSAAALFTSIEMGVYPFIGALAALSVSRILKIQEAKLIVQGLAGYIIGFGFIAVPFVIYMAWHAALVPYLDAVWTIVTRMQKVIDPHFVSVYPGNLTEAVVAMTNPGHTNFKHMTPAYLYIFIAVYLLLRLKKKALAREDLMVICLGVYGFIMYNTGFRGIWAAQFEMALQPEKILLFFMFEVFLFAAMAKRRELLPALKAMPSLKWYSRQKWALYVCNVFMFVLLGSSIGYPLQRFNHRFFAFKFVRDKIAGKDTARLRPLAKEEARTADLKRASGILLPAVQAQELEVVAAFAAGHIKEDEVMFTYPELGTYNFFAGRRFFGKFPISTFTWFNDRWHAEYMAELKSSRPKFAVVQKEISQNWKDVYLALEPNREKYKDVMDFIQSEYSLFAETPLSYIYALK